MGVNGSSVEGRVRGLSENYLGFRALEFRPLNPVSVGLRIYGRNLNAIFLFVILYRLILNPLLIVPAEFGAHSFTPRHLFLLLLLCFLLACCRFEERIINRGSSIIIFFLNGFGLARQVAFKLFLYRLSRRDEQEIKRRENQEGIF